LDFTSSKPANSIGYIPINVDSILKI